MRAIAVAVGILLLAGCRAAPLSSPPEDPARADLACLGEGAAPGDAEGPGGFVPRRNARNFYAGAAGRLWYYMNNYYWVPKEEWSEDLWIRAEVVEHFADLRRWPDGREVAGPEPKVTVEYWRVGPTGRSVRLDNHKDYLLLSDELCAGAVEVRVTLALGRVRVADARGRWESPRESYVLESRNYGDGRGIGADRARFEGRSGSAVNTWGYRIDWSTHPQRTTRSDWAALDLPEWRLIARTSPPTRPRPAVTAGDAPVEAR